MHIRLAQVEDCESILALLEQVFIVHQQLRPDLFRAPQQAAQERTAQGRTTQGNATKAHTKYTRQELEQRIRAMQSCSLLDTSCVWSTSFDEPILVAEHNNRVVGYALCWLEIVKGDAVRIDEHSMFLDDLCVDSAARGIGVGSALLDAVEKLAAIRKCQSVTLHVWHGNTPAENLYASHGFSERVATLEKKVSQ